MNIRPVFQFHQGLMGRPQAFIRIISLKIVKEMKNVFFTMALCLGMTALSAQQSFTIGPVIGVNFSKISDFQNVDTEFRPGLALGGQLTYSTLANWGIGGALLYSQEGVAATVAGLETKLRLTYLRIPVKGFIFLGGNDEGSFRPKVFLGPSFGFLLDADAEVGGKETGVKDSYNNFDLGLTGGLGFNARVSQSTWFNFDAGYTHGLLDVAKNNDGANRTFTLTAGVGFGF